VTGQDPSFPSLTHSGRSRPSQLLFCRLSVIQYDVSKADIAAMIITATMFDLAVAVSPRPERK